MRYNDSSTEYTLPLNNLYDKSLTLVVGFDVLNKKLWKGSFQFRTEKFPESNYRNSFNLNFDYSF